MPLKQRAPIAAISTAPYNAAIGVVRLSGEGAHEIAARVFRPVGGRPLLPVSARRAVLGDVFDVRGGIDRAVLTCWSAPHSYTGEDLAEFSCHGGRVVLFSVLAALLEAGAHPAGPGEFTKRAFLNGKMDLAESEAVIDLIMAESTAAARAALSQAGGALSAALRDIRALLVEADADIMAYVDFSDEGVVEADPGALCAKLEQAVERLDALLATAARGQVVREGAVTALVGKPNVGKSSLLNALAGMERSIVTEMAGTTRDVVEQPLTVGGLLLRVQDTAGLRPTDDAVERLGVARSRRAAEEAQLLLAVFDGSADCDGQDLEVAALCHGKTAIALLNKCDLPQRFDPSLLQRQFECILPVSAVTGAGLDALERAVSALFLPQEDETLLTSLRHAQAARAARDSVQQALTAIRAGVEPDIAEIDIREAIVRIGHITGQDASDDVIENIFSRFCVGK